MDGAGLERVSGGLQANPDPVDRFMALREVTYKMLLYENLVRTEGSVT